MKQKLLLLVSSNGLAANPNDEIHVLQHLLYHPIHSPLGLFDLNYFLLINIVVIHVPHVSLKKIYLKIYLKKIYLNNKQQGFTYLGTME